MYLNLFMESERMIKNPESRSLAVTLFGVIAMSVLMACGGGVIAESAKSATTSEAMTKAIEAPVEAEKTGPASAIASMIKAAESISAGSEAAQVAETLTKALEPVLEELIKTATSDAKELADGIAKAMEAEEPLMESLMQAAEKLMEGMTDTAAIAMSAGASSQTTSTEDLVNELKDMLEDSTVLSVLTEQEPPPALATTFELFDFTLTMDLGSEVKTAQGSASKQGAINFAVGELNSILTWVPQEGSTNLAFVSGTYEILKANQTNVSFDSVNDGAITVDGQEGAYLGFKSADDTGASLGGGLIGAWTCADAGTAYTLTMTGADAGTLQIRFDRLLENFTCAA